MTPTRMSHHTGCNHCLLTRIESLCDTLSLEEIAAMDDLVMRNYCISATYYRISHAMTTIVGPGNATWTTYASWASEQAGRSIRLENIPFARWNPLGYADRVRAVISLGNLRVFVEIAPLFDRFIRWMRDGSDEQPRRDALAAGPEALERLVQARMAFDPRTLAESPDGQALLISGFASYLEAAYTADPDLRAEYIFLGNAMVGLHEQTRVDPEVVGALTMPELEPWVELWQQSAAGSISSAVGRRVRKFAGRARRLADFADAGYVRALREKADLAVIGTQVLMTLRVGDDVLRLGEDIPAAGPTPFPAHLQTFDNPCGYFRARLEKVLALDKTPHTLEGSAATNWTRLSDRMNFILDLFRSRQQTPALFNHSLHVDCPPQAGCTCGSAGATARGGARQAA